MASGFCETIMDLTHYLLVMPYGDKDISHKYLR